MKFERRVKCKKCKKKQGKMWVYKFWHFVECTEAIVGPFDSCLTWQKTWRLCNACNPQGTVHARFHDIDGFTYFIDHNFPFIHRG